MKKERLLYHVRSMAEELRSINIGVKFNGLLNIINDEIEKNESTRESMIKSDRVMGARLAEERIEYSTILYMLVSSVLTEILEAEKEIEENYLEIKKALSDECLATESDNATINK